MDLVVQTWWTRLGVPDLGGQTKAKEAHNEKKGKEKATQAMITSPQID